MRVKDLKGKRKTRLSIQRMNFMLGPYFHIDMIWIYWSYIVWIALLKATNALLKVFTKISKHINIRLFYFTQCGSLPLFFFFFFFFFFIMIVLLNTWIYFQFFLKIDLILWDKLNCNFKYIFFNEISFIKKIVLAMGQINKK